MAEPTIQAAQPTTLPQTQTSGFSDPSFMEGITAAFAAAGKGTVAPPQTEPVKADAPEAEVENPLAAPVEEPKQPAKQQAKPEPKQPEQPQPQPVKEKAKTWKEQWKELHQLKDSAEKRAKELESKYQQLEERYRGHDPEEVKKIRAERDDLSNRLKAFAVEHDPEFEAAMNTKLGRLKNEAEAVLGENAKKFMGLLGLPDGEFKRSQLSALTQDMDEFSKYEVAQLVREHRQIAMERSEYLKNASENYQKILDTQARQQEQVRERIGKQFEDTVRQWQDPEKGNPVLKLRDGDEAWNQEVQATIQQARDILNGKLPADDLIRASLWSASAPRILTAMHNLQKERDALAAEVQSLKAVSPDPTSQGTGTASQDDDESEYKGMSYPEIIANKALKAGGFSR